MSLAPTLAELRAAVAAWARTSTGYAAGKVIWSGQGAPRPPAPYISLAIISGDQMKGLDWLDVEDAAAPVDGAEIAHVARGPRTATLSVQAFGLAASAADASGDSPLAVLAAMRAKARLPTIRAALLAAGVGVGTMTDVIPVDALISTVTAEPRAAFTVTVNYVSEVEETGTYIETVEVDAELEA